MTNEELDRTFWELKGDFDKWQNDVITFINKIEDPEKKEWVRDLILSSVIGTSKLHINVGTGNY